jgi:hypothetical protein
MERKQGGSMVVSVLVSLGSTLLAVVALVVLMPLWFIPPLEAIRRWIWGRLHLPRICSTRWRNTPLYCRKRILRERRGNFVDHGVASVYRRGAQSVYCHILSCGLAVGARMIWIYTWCSPLVRCGFVTTRWTAQALR